jgi:hypothetical protein
LTAVFVWPATVAVNFAEVPTSRLVVVGVIEMLTGGAGSGRLIPPPPQPKKNVITVKTSENNKKRFPIGDSSSYAPTLERLRWFLLVAGKDISERYQQRRAEAEGLASRVGGT